MKTWTPTKIRALKGVEKFATITCYDATSALLVDGCGFPFILVGDSLGMVMQGRDSTLPVTLDDMIYHTQCVTRVVKDALVVTDMPFMSYQTSIEEGIENAGRIIKESGADAVKVEGGMRCVALVQRLVEIGIPVVAHLGMTPQSCLAMGGFKVQGREESARKRIVEEAKALEEAGVFCIVVECVPASLGKEITDAVSVPVIGIGAGSDTDGQILVFQDMLGLTQGKCAKFVKRFAQAGAVIQTALTEYRDEVKTGKYPSAEQVYN